MRNVSKGFFCPWPGPSVWLLSLLCPTEANECDSSLMKPVGKPSLSSCVGSKNNLLSKFPENGFGYLLCWYTYLYWLGTDMLCICTLSLSGFLPLSSVYPSIPYFSQTLSVSPSPSRCFPDNLFVPSLCLFTLINLFLLVFRFHGALCEKLEAKSLGSFIWLLRQMKRE